MTSTMTPPAATSTPTRRADRTRSLAEPRRAPRTTPTPVATTPAKPAIPTKEDIIAAAMKQTGCSEAQAISFFEEAVLKPATMRLQMAAEPTYAIHHIQQAPLDLMHDAVLDVLIPDNATAEPGSVHEMGNQHASAIVGEPVEIVHSKYGDGPAAWCGTTARLRTPGQE